MELLQDSEIVEDWLQPGQVAEITAWGRREATVGRALMAGMVVLLENGTGPVFLGKYLKAVMTAGRITPVMARSAAEKFVPVCISGDENLYEHTLQLYQRVGPWGPWPLGQVSNGILALLEEGGATVADRFALMILAALDQGIEEKPLIRLVDRLVPGIRALDGDKCLWQAGQLCRVVEVDFNLGRSFLHGLDRGLRFLKEKALAEFVDAALSGENRGDRYSRFLALEAIAARELNRRLQTMVSLRAQLPALHRYLQIRGGFSLNIRPLAEIPRTVSPHPVASCNDGRCIYLPAEMEIGRDVEENRIIYRILAGLELSLLEAGCFDFDVASWLENRAENELLPGFIDRSAAAPAAFPCSDYYTFFAFFPHPPLAEKLFVLAEFTRVQGFLERCYPGFARRSRALLEDLPVPASPEAAWIQGLYLTLVPGRSRAVERVVIPEELSSLAESMRLEAAGLRSVSATVADSADWVVRAYERLGDNRGAVNALLDFSFPFGRTLRYDLYYLAGREYEERAEGWRKQLAAGGVRVEKGLLRRLLKDESRELTPELLKRLLERSGRLKDREGQRIVRLPPEVDLAALFPENSGDRADFGHDDPVPTFWYDEWDYRLNDYLRRHVKLLEHRRVGGDADFYREALAEHRGLIRRIRRNFELIRPQAIQILRHWPEGDAFDYDALIEYAIDRRMKITPDDRFYRKRLKVERDVAVFVLVDLSSSTRKEVADGGGKTILAVEKEALVLFCEALERVGDSFAIAGFSGSGRLAVEFFYLKSFAEPLNDEVKARIGGLRPEKNTRMGPALRHAARELKGYPARVKLMIILSDGLPNDQDYSNDYAIADSRAAIRESRSAFIHVHAITVNSINSPHLDSLYGDVNHTVIADVRYLPDKLPRIYRALTRN
ncbi:MAG: VWA domain-containing protein [Deltaproteobacteria bacterium]|nr:VWA domain-containing protein [Deltaproteobacteria bacterium]